MQEIKKRPILFSTPMVQAILAGRKTMTRRVVKPQPIIDQDSGYVYSGDHRNMYKNDSQHIQWQDAFAELCPYGHVGDVLWVRETYGIGDKSGALYYRANTNYPDTISKWKPSIFMPYTACRLFLLITDIRVERLQDISEEDAISEGVTDREIYPIYPLDFKVCPACGGDGTHTALGPNLGVMEVDCTTCDTYKNRFKILWENIHTLESWQDNPWVWVISFERINKPE